MEPNAVCSTLRHPPADVGTGYCCTIRLARRAQANALNLALLEALVTAFRSEICRGARAIYLDGEGEIFSAGLDLKWLEALRHGSRASREIAGDALATLLDTVAGLDAPVVAFAGRGAFGAGIGLLAAADWVVADPAARFRMSEARLGISGGVLLKTLRRKVSEAALRQWVLTAGDFDAATAVAAGLVTDLVAADRREAHRVELDRQFAVLAPSVLGQFKRAVRSQIPSASDGRLLADALESDDGAEGLRAFWERRPPRWL